MAKTMILSIPDRFKITEAEWQGYIQRIMDKKPTEKQKIAYELFNKKIDDTKNF